jgi:hypothetical protein
MLQERGSTKRALQQLHKMGLKRHKALKRLIVQLEDERSDSTNGSGEPVRCTVFLISMFQVLLF